MFVLSQTKMVKVLHPTQYQTSHFGDVLLNQFLSFILKKLDPTQKQNDPN